MSRARDDLATFLRTAKWQPPCHGVRSITVRDRHGSSFTMDVDGNDHISTLKEKLYNTGCFNYMTSPALVVPGKNGMENAFENDAKSISEAGLIGEVWLVPHERFDGLCGGAGADEVGL
jgi:hypothetical protein